MHFSRNFHGILSGNFLRNFSCNFPEGSSHGIYKGISIGISQGTSKRISMGNSQGISQGISMDSSQGISMEVLRETCFASMISPDLYIPWGFYGVLLLVNDFFLLIFLYLCIDFACLFSIPFFSIL